MLSIICNSFPLGVALSAFLIKFLKRKKKAKAHECQETLGARHLPRPPPHQAGSWQRKPARGPILTGRIFQSRRRDRNRHPLENRRPGPRPPSPPPPRPRGIGPEPHTHHRRWPGRRRLPPGPRGAPGRRQVQTSPPLRGGGAGHRRLGSAALNNGRLGRAQRAAPRLQRLRCDGPRARGCWGVNPGEGPGGCGGHPTTRPPRPRGPRWRIRARSALATR